MPDLDPGARRARYEIYRDYLKHEDGLINHRLTWTLSAQAFLFAGFGLSVQKLAELEEKVRSEACISGHDVDWAAWLARDQIALLQNLTHWVLPVLGISIACVALLGIHAAQSALFKLADLWEASEVQYAAEQALAALEAGPHPSRAAEAQGVNPEAPSSTQGGQIAEARKALCKARARSRRALLKENKKKRKPGLLFWRRWAQPFTRPVLPLLPPLAGGGALGAKWFGKVISLATPMIILAAWVVLFFISSCPSSDKNDKCPSSAALSPSAAASVVSATPPLFAAPLTTATPTVSAPQAPPPPPPPTPSHSAAPRPSLSAGSAN